MLLDYLPDALYQEIYKIVFSDTLFAIKTISKSYGIRGQWVWGAAEDEGVNTMTVTYYLANRGGWGIRTFYLKE